MPFWNLHEMENIFKKKECLLAYIDSKVGGYLSAWIALLQNSFR